MSFHDSFPQSIAPISDGQAAESNIALAFPPIGMMQPLSSCTTPPCGVGTRSSSLLIVQHPPAKLNLSSGSQLQLLCRAASPTGECRRLGFQWYHVTRELDTNAIEGGFSEQLDLRVKGEQDSGTYYCRVSLGRQKVFSQPCNVVVEVDN